MLPMEFPEKLKKLGYKNIKHGSLPFMITNRDQNSPARYTEQVMSAFALRQGLDKNEVREWQDQIGKAEIDGRFGFTSYPVLTMAVLL